MLEFMSSPFGLVAVGLGVLAIAVLALCLWITALDRRMRGMADGLEAERRKVAEMQMVIGRRNNANRGYAAPRPARGAAPMTGQVPMAGATAAGVPVQGVPQGQPARPSVATRVPRGAAVSAAATYGGPATAPRPASPPGAGWTPNSIPLPINDDVDAWVQGGPQSFSMPEKKMSRRARREAERAFAARAAAELEARQARRAQEAAFAQRMPGAGIPGAGVPAPGYGVPQGYPGAGAYGRHAR